MYWIYQKDCYLCTVEIIQPLKNTIMKLLTRITIALLLIFIAVPLVINILLFIVTPGVVFFIGIICAIYLFITGVAQDFKKN